MCSRKQIDYKRSRGAFPFFGFSRLCLLIFIIIIVIIMDLSFCASVLVCRVLVPVDTWLAGTRHHRRAVDRPTRAWLSFGKTSASGEQLWDCPPPCLCQLPCPATPQVSLLCLYHVLVVLICYFSHLLLFSDLPGYNTTPNRINKAAASTANEAYYAQLLAKAVVADRQAAELLSAAELEDAQSQFFSQV